MTALGQDERDVLLVELQQAFSKISPKEEMAASLLGAIPQIISMVATGKGCEELELHPDIGDEISIDQYERLKHVNVLPPGRMRAGLFQALGQKGLRREVAVSVTHFLAVPEMIAVTDYCATLPSLICKRLANDHRLKVLPAPVDLGTFPVEMAWHVRHRNDPAHRWFRSVIGELTTTWSRREDSIEQSV